MICAPLNRERSSSVSSRGYGLYPNLEKFSGLRSQPVLYS
jgi:hypothetical protein